MEGRFANYEGQQIQVATGRTVNVGPNTINELNTVNNYLQADNGRWWYAKGIEVIINYDVTTGGGVSIDFNDTGRSIDNLQLQVHGWPDYAYQLQGNELRELNFSRMGKVLGMDMTVAAAQAAATIRLRCYLPLCGAIGEQWTDSAVLLPMLQSLVLSRTGTFVATGGNATVNSCTADIILHATPYHKLLAPAQFSAVGQSLSMLQRIEIVPSDLLHNLFVTETDDSISGIIEARITTMGRQRGNAWRLRDLAAMHNRECIESSAATSIVANAAGAFGAISLVNNFYSEVNPEVAHLVWEPNMERRLTKVQPNVGGTVVETNTAFAAASRYVSLRSWAGGIDSNRGREYISKAVQRIDPQGGLAAFTASENSDKVPRENRRIVPDRLRYNG